VDRDFAPFAARRDLLAALLEGLTYQQIAEIWPFVGTRGGAVPPKRARLKKELASLGHDR
jgi:hypothetical protein